MGNNKQYYDEPYFYVAKISVRRIVCTSPENEDMCLESIGDMDE